MRNNGEEMVRNQDDEFNYRVAKRAGVFSLCLTFMFVTTAEVQLASSGANTSNTVIGKFA